MCTREMYSRESTRSVPRYGIGSRLPVVCLRCFDPRKLYFHGTSGKQRTRRQLVRKCPTSPLLLTEWELLPNRTHLHTWPPFAEDSSVLEQFWTRVKYSYTGHQRTECPRPRLFNLRILWSIFYQIFTEREINSGPVLFLFHLI